jgi:hypothetical protein
VKVLKKLELVSVGTKQLHDNGGAVGLYGVSHGGLQLHVPHSFRLIDSSAWLLYLDQRRPTILVFIVRQQCVPCPSERIDNLAIIVDVLAGVMIMRLFRHECLFEIFREVGTE